MITVIDYVRSEALTVMTMGNAVLDEVMPCSWLKRNDISKTLSASFIRVVMQRMKSMMWTQTQSGPV